MRTGIVTINEKQYLVCFSTRVMLALEERGGDADQELKKILDEHKMSSTFWLLAQMIDAGDRYAKLEGMDNPGTLSFDQLVDLVGIDEYDTMFRSVWDAIKVGGKPTVHTKVKQEKNAETTPPDA